MLDGLNRRPPPMRNGKSRRRLLGSEKSEKLVELKPRPLSPGRNCPSQAIALDSKIKATHKSVRVPLPFRVANWTGSAIQVISRRPIISLSPDSLWAAAERRSGLPREENPSIGQRLEILVRASGRRSVPHDRGALTWPG